MSEAVSVLLQVDVAVSVLLQVDGAVSVLLQVGGTVSPVTNVGASLMGVPVTCSGLRIAQLPFPDYVKTWFLYIYIYI